MKTEVQGIDLLLLSNSQMRESINNSAIADFLKAIDATNSTATKIHIIADESSSYTAKEVALFLSQTDKTTATSKTYDAYFAYSPNLNHVK